MAALLGCNTAPPKDVERFGYYRFIKSGKAGPENTWKTEKLQGDDLLGTRQSGQTGQTSSPATWQPFSGLVDYVPVIEDT